MSKSRAAAQAQRERQIVEQFRLITQATPEVAAKVLKQYGWRFDEAVDQFYAHPEWQVDSKAVERALEGLWKKYQDPADPSHMLVPDGLISYGSDLSLDLSSSLALAVGHRCGATHQAATWTKTAWVAGWKELSADSLEKQRAEVGKMRAALRTDPAYFARVYQYTFDLGKAEGARILEHDDATQYWRILLAPLLPTSSSSTTTTTPTSPPAPALSNPDTGAACAFTTGHLAWWFAFLDERAGKNGVNKDGWYQFLDFIKQIDAQFEEYDESAAWPSVIDDFVEYARDRIGAGEDPTQAVLDPEEGEGGEEGGMQVD